MKARCCSRELCDHQAQYWLKDTSWESNPLVNLLYFLTTAAPTYTKCMKGATVNWNISNNTSNDSNVCSVMHLQCFIKNEYSSNPVPIPQNLTMVFSLKPQSPGNILYVPAEMSPTPMTSLFVALCVWFYLTHVTLLNMVNMTFASWFLLQTPSCPRLWSSSLGLWWWPKTLMSGDQGYVTAVRTFLSVSIWFILKENCDVFFLPGTYVLVC